MSLSIRSRQVSDVVVLQCVGRIVRGESLRLLRDAVTSLTQPRVVVLDLSDAKMIDGGGLGMLVFLHCWSLDHGIQLTVVNPSALVLEVLEQTELTRVLHISSVDDAMDVLCKNRRTFEWRGGIVDPSLHRRGPT